MSTETLEIPAELKKFTPEQLKAALQAQENKKQEDVAAYKELAEQAAAKALFKLAVASETLSNAKTEVFQYFENILKLKADLYGVKAKQQSHTFSFAGGEITIGYRINDGWDDTVNEGIAKVNNFISSLAKDDATAALVNVVFNLLKKDTKGNLKGSRVLELQKLTKEFNNEDFSDGVEIIAAAYKPRRSVWFVDAAIIKEDSSKTPIPLAISSVDFSQGYKFDYYNENTRENASE